MPGLIKLPLWWGWLDDRGVITIKRYTNDRIIQNTEQLPFCKGIFDVFEAASLQEAYTIAHQKLKEVEMHDKRQN